MMRETEVSETAAVAPVAPITDLRRRWLFTQAQLVDDPRDAALDAGRLVGDALRLAKKTFDQHRDWIERGWRDDSDPDTDELRSVMQLYRSLFEYVLAADELVEEVETVRRELAATRGGDPADAMRQGAESKAGHAANRARRRPRRLGRAALWIVGLDPSRHRKPAGG